MTERDCLKEILEKAFYLNGDERQLVSEAFLFAQKAHDGQKRKSGEPYLVHLVETAKILAELKMDGKTVAAGLLHDSVEDGVATEEELEKKFGCDIAFMVDGVTKLGKVRYRGLKRHNESLRKLFVATSKDIRVLIIKFADRLHNMRTLEYVRADKQVRIATETLEIYAPLAYRLGITSLSRQLEDLAFKYVYPEEYKKTLEILEERQKQSILRLDKTIKSIKRKLADAGICDFTSMHRVKGVYSTYKKLQRKDWNISAIFDILAIRIIVPKTEDCYRVLGVIHKNFRPVPGRIKDYIAVPKPNGYRSLHTTIFTGDGNIVEIQIRTQQMHDEAEFGAASHLGYKAEKGLISGVKEKDKDWVSALLGFFKDKKDEKEDIVPVEDSKKDSKAWIKDLAETSCEVKDKSELMDDFFSHRVFVFTPEGDVVDLPENSTPVDFAFQIHTDLGKRIVAAEVNGKFKSLDTPLKNGDIVKVVTKQGARPNKKWLAFVKTNTAKRKIRSYCKDKDKESTLTSPTSSHLKT